MPSVPNGSTLNKIRVGVVPGPRESFSAHYLLLCEGTFASFFKDKKSKRTGKNIKRSRGKTYWKDTQVLVE
jgi:hypothetical protein